MIDKENVPSSLFHFILGGYTGFELSLINATKEAILNEGLLPQVATAYCQLLPGHIRELPVVWLVENPDKLSFPRTLKISTMMLDRDLLHKLDINDVDWWVYQGRINPEYITGIVVQNGGGAS